MESKEGELTISATTELESDMAGASSLPRPPSPPPPPPPPSPPPSPSSSQIIIPTIGDKKELVKEICPFDEPRSGGSSSSSSSSSDSNDVIIPESNFKHQQQRPLNEEYEDEDISGTRSTTATGSSDDITTGLRARHANTVTTSSNENAIINPIAVVDCIIGNGGHHSTTTTRVLPDRPDDEVARDTKRILEICYGKMEDDDSIVIDDEALTELLATEEEIDGITKKKKKKKTTKKGKKKRSKTKNESDPNDDTTSTRQGDNGEIGDGAVGATEEDGSSASATSTTATTKKKKRRKIRKKKNGTKKTPIVSRDAAGKIVRKRRKIKGRHKVVRKQFIKKGKDAKMALPTITEDLNDDDDDDDNDNESYVYISSNEEDDENDNVNGLYDDNIDGVDDRETKEDDADADDDANDDADDDDDDDDQEIDNLCHDIEEGEIVSCEDEEEEDNVGERIESEHDEGHRIYNEGEVLSLVERCPVPQVDQFSNIWSNEGHAIPNNDGATTRMIVDVTPATADIEAHLESSLSVASVGSTECTSTAREENIREETSLPFFGSYRNMICAGVLFVIVVAASTVLVVYFLSIKDKDYGNPIVTPSFAPNGAPQSGQYPSLRPSLPPSDRLKPSSIPTTTPTSPPTTIFSTSSTSCQLPIQKSGVQTIETEYASKQFGNSTIGNTNDGYCGEGYITNLMRSGSGFEFLPLEVNTTGYYRVALRYNNAGKTETSLRLRINDIEEGEFDLISTGNKTTWMVGGIDNILLRQGKHVIHVSVPSDDTNSPNVDWLTLSLKEPVSRFDYLVTLLAQFIDVTKPSKSQISALAWMSSKDPIDWSTLTNQEIIERYALVQIYYSAEGDTWFNNNQWLSEFHGCGWYGITCSKDKLVTDLMLDSNGLTGPLPTDLFLLTNLILISLDTNSLEGTIGAKIRKLEKLSELFLQANFLTGFLPSALGSLENLKTVDLRANDLNGPIPEEIYYMRRLETLALASNDLEGIISTNIGKLRALKDLDLQSDQLSGTLPTELGELTLLTSLALGYNTFSGSIPGELGLLTNLAVLDVNSNQLTGILPPELSLLNETLIDYYGNNIVE